MRRRRRSSCSVGGRRAMVTLAAVVAVLSTFTGLPPSVGQEIEDPRSTELATLACESSLASSRLTLFGNGTVRLWRGRLGAERMRLAELGDEQLEAYLRRLVQEDLSEAPSSLPTVEGSWVERCTLRLRLPDQAPRDFGFGRYDSLPLSLARILRVLDDLAAEVPLESGPGLPEGYDPRPGDVLERGDGARFEVVAKTGGDEGVELEGMDQPLVIYVALDELGTVFRRLVSRRSPLGPTTPRGPGR